MDACVWIACLMICGFFFLGAIVIGAHLLLIGLLGGGLFAIVLGLGSVFQGDIGNGLFLIAVGCVMLSIPLRILGGGGSASRAKRRVR